MYGSCCFCLFNLFSCLFCQLGECYIRGRKVSISLIHGIKVEKSKGRTFFGHSFLCIISFLCAVVSLPSLVFALRHVWVSQSPGQCWLHVRKNCGKNALLDQRVMGMWPHAVMSCLEAFHQF